MEMKINDNNYLSETAIDMIAKELLVNYPDLNSNES